MKKDNEIEKILLNDEAYEKFINSKIEKEFKDITSENSKNKDKIIEEFKDVPSDKLFSKNATYLVMNKQSKTQSYINGVQAEGFLGSENTLRNKLLNKECDYFVCGNSYIKFFNYKY